MSTTLAEVVLLLRGTAPDELKARFLSETESRENGLLDILKGAEQWAHNRLNSSSPSAAPADCHADPNTAGISSYVVLMKAGFADRRSEDRRRIVIDDVVAYIKGLASYEVIIGIRQALADPDSELSTILKELPQYDE